MTYCDVLFQLVRVLIYFGIVYGTHRYLKEKHEHVEYTWWIGVAAMISVYYLLKLVFELLGYKHLGAFDGIYIYDMSNNKVIIPAILYFDKFDGDSMLTHMKSKILKYKRLRSTFVNVFDQWYLKELAVDKLMNAVDDAFLKVEQNYKGDPIKTEKALIDFLANEVSIPFEEGKLFYKVFVVENYSETQSVVMFKSHHCLADGMSLVGLLTSLQDVYDVN